MPSSTSEASRRRLGLRVASRRSPLARRQVEIVAELLEGAGGVALDPVLVETAGDRRRAEPLRSIGGQGVFVAEVRRAVLDGRADMAVHSAKDLPASPGLGDDGLVIAAVPSRGDPRDALVGCRFADLAPGAVVATGAPRRRAQLAWLRPDLGFVELRGNIGTRLSRVPRGGAVVVAAAALDRLELHSGELVVDVMGTGCMLPQVGQGALAVECRADDAATRQLLGCADHEPSHRALRAERAFLSGLGGGCELPVGAYATVGPDGLTTLEGMIATPDGHALVRRRGTGDDPEELGARVAGELLDQCGGRYLIEGVG